MLDATDWRKVQALQDIQHALSAWTFFAEIGSHTTTVGRRRFRCFHDAMVVYYCRPFTQSKGLPILSLRKLGIEPNVEERALHKRLMDFRNKVVAHTDEDRMRILLTSFELIDGYAMPMVVQDEGFEFLADHTALETWLRKLVGTLAQFVFDKVQELPTGSKHARDYLQGQLSSKKSPT